MGPGRTGLLLLLREKPAQEIIEFGPLEQVLEGGRHEGAGDGFPALNRILLQSVFPARGIHEEENRS